MRIMLTLLLAALLAAPAASQAESNVSVNINVGAAVAAAPATAGPPQDLLRDPAVVPLAAQSWHLHRGGHAPRPGAGFR